MHIYSNIIMMHIYSNIRMMHCKTRGRARTETAASQALSRLLATQVGGYWSLQNTWYDYWEIVVILALSWQQGRGDGRLVKEDHIQRSKKGWSAGALLQEGNGQNHSWQKDLEHFYRTCRDFNKQGYLSFCRGIDQKNILL